MTLKTAIVITGDTAGAGKAVDDLVVRLQKLDSTTVSSAEAVTKLDKAQGDAAASSRAAADGADLTATAQANAASATRDLAQATAATSSAQDGASSAARDAAAIQDKLAEATAKAAAEATRAAGATTQVAATSAAAKQQLGEIGAAQGAAAVKAEAHTAAATELQSAIGAMVQQVSGGATVFDAMAANGGTFAAALAAVVQASTGANVSIQATAESGAKAGVDLGGLGDTVRDVAGEATDMGGKLGTVAAFMGGPWGAAIGIAINFLGGLVQGFIESADASDDMSKATLSLVDALEKEKFATDEGRKAIEAYNEQQEKARKENELATRQSLASAEARLKDAESIRKITKAALEHARDVARASDGVSGGTVPGSAGILPNLKVTEISGKLREQDEAIKELQQSRRELQIKVGTSDGEAAADPVKKINLQYDLERQAAEKAAASNDRLAKSYDRTVAAIERRRAADLADEQERQRRLRAKPKKESLGDQIEAGSAAAMLATAERYRGLSENKGSDRAQLKDLFAKANANIDPQMVAWCAAFVNSVLASNGVKGTGSLSARSFLGFGSSTDSPNKGYIVVSRRGNNAAQGHVGFYQGTDAQGRVLVLGGNTGDRVGTQAIDRRDVLGFRRAPSGADAYKDELKAAQDAKKLADDAAKDFQKDLEQVTGLYLPATAEAKKYADELARINALAKAYDPKVAGSGLSPAEADAARAALATAHQERLDKINLTPEAKAAQDAKKSIDAVIVSLGQEVDARKALTPVQRDMIKHQDELAKLSGAERTEREASLKGYYEQIEASKAVDRATRDAAQAQALLRDMALDAFEAIALGGEHAGDVIKRLAARLASAAVEATVLGTGPLAALLKGATAGPVASAATGSSLQQSADLVGKSVGKSVGDRLDGVFGKGNGANALKNAGVGYAAASITGGSGLAGSAVGLVGGELGKKLLTGVLGSAAGPLGAIAGGILGGLVGGLFKTAKYGTASVSSNGSTTSVGTSGNDSNSKGTASGLAGQVQQGIAAIVQQLGGSLGSYNVSIGTYDGKYRVSTSGQSGEMSWGKKNKANWSTLHDFGDDQAGAVAYAIADAIADGAVKGLSARVQKAINSSTDINKALAEAMKVQQLELDLGGIQATIDKAFKDFEAQAQERMRLATAYGFDVVAIEKRNGEDRKKLAEQLAQQQVGSLQKLVDEMTRGSLFEGTAMERITKLNEAIAKAKADLDAGKEGAADTLADLYQQKIAASKEAYGSTSAYAADRTAILNEANAAIAKANARILAAQNGGASDPALATTNASLATANTTLDEMADQNARMVAALEQNNALMSELVKGGASSSLLNLERLAAV